MVRDINGLDGTSVRPNRLDQGSSKASNSSGTATQAETTTTSSGNSGDDVQISAEAKTLQSLTDNINQLPEVNLERAERIKAALENGEYRVDELVVADKLLNSESLFD